MVALTDAPFYAPLKNTLNLSNGSGNATFTRATVATVFDNEGKLVTILANIPRFGGARRVENLIDNTVLPTVTTGTGNVSLSNGVFTLNNSASGSFTLYRYTGSNIANTQYRASLQYRKISGTGTLTVDINDAGIQVLNPSDGNWYTHTTNVVTISHPSTRWFDLQVSANSVYEVKLIQLENVTGQADQTMSDFVSGTQWFTTNKDGSAIPDANLLGVLLNNEARTNNLLHCRDLSNVAWVKANVTVAIDQIGIDKKANSASKLTATSSNATVLQTITSAATPASSSFYVKRFSGTGLIYFTRDGGTNWKDITNEINSNSFSRVKIENTSVTNPVVGFKIASNGDAIVVDYGQNEAGIDCSMPIFTTTASVTRNVDVLTYPSANNYSSISGTVILDITSDNWNNANGSILGSTTNGLFMVPSGVQLRDGTNIVNGPSIEVQNHMKIGYKYSGSSMKAFADGRMGSSGSYDGAWNLTNIGLATGARGYIRDLAIWPSQLDDSEIISLTVIDANDKYIIKNARRQAVVSIRGSGQANISVQELACVGQTVDVANVDLTIAGMFYQLFSSANIVRNGNVVLNLVAGYDTVKFAEDFGFVLNRNANSNIIVNLGGGNNYIAFQLTKGVGYNEADNQVLLPWQK